MRDTGDSTLRFDSADDAEPAGDRHSIRAYVSDMLVLERHIRRPLERQLDLGDTAAYSDAARIISTLRGLADAHIARLEPHVDALGGSAASPVKSAWAEFLAQAAAAVDGVRGMKTSRNLRDDYTALSLASISYAMLRATALGQSDGATALLAQHHLDDYAPLIVEIGNVMNTVVVAELAEEAGSRRSV